MRGASELREVRELRNAREAVSSGWTDVAPPSHTQDVTGTANREHAHMLMCINVHAHAHALLLYGDV